MLFSYPMPFLFKKWCVVLREPKQDFPYTSYFTNTDGDAGPLLAFCLKQIKSRHIPTTKQSWHKADHPVLCDSHCCSPARWPPQHSMLPASGSLCGCEDKTAALALQPAVPVSLWSSGSQIWEAAGFEFLI